MKTIQEIGSELIESRKRYMDIVYPLKNLTFDSEFHAYMRYKNEGLGNMMKQFGIETSDDIEETSYLVYLSENGHSNLSQILRIPKQFYDRLKKDYPGLLSTIINELIERKDNYLFRGIRDDNTGRIQVRAILSSKYRIINNIDVFGATIEALSDNAEMGMYDLHDYMLTDKMMQFTFHGRDKLNHTLFGEYTHHENSSFKLGFTIRNSETGNSTLRIVPHLLVGWCSNGMPLYKYGTYKTHLGIELDPMIELSKTTMNYLDRGMKGMIRDAIVKYTTDAEWITKILDNIMEANNEPINSEQTKALVSPMGYSDDEIGWLMERMSDYTHPDKNIAYQCILEQAKAFTLERRINTEEMVSDMMLANVKVA